MLFRSSRGRLPGRNRRRMRAVSALMLLVGMLLRCESAPAISSVSSGPRSREAATESAIEDGAGMLRGRKKWTVLRRSGSGADDSACSAGRSVRRKVGAGMLRGSPGETKADKSPLHQPGARSARIVRVRGAAVEVWRASPRKSSQNARGRPGHPDRPLLAMQRRSAGPVDRAHVEFAALAVADRAGFCTGRARVHVDVGGGGVRIVAGAPVTMNTSGNC